MAPLFEKVAVGALASALTGGVATVLTNLHTNAVQTEKIHTLETRADKTDELIEVLKETGVEVRLLNQRLELMNIEEQP